MAEIQNVEKTYYSIFNGQLCRKPKFNEEKVETRSYTKKDGEKINKTAIFVGGYSGRITNIKIVKNEYKGSKWKSLNIDITDGIDEVVITLSDKYMTSFLSLVHNINFDEDVKIVPYKDKKDNGRVSVKQNDEKIAHYYYDFDKKVAINGVEKIEKPGMGAESDDWKIYFMAVNRLLEKNFETDIVPKFKVIQKEVEKGEEPALPETEEDDDLPF